MPIYEYQCTKCGKVQDRLVSFRNADEQQCDCEDDAPLKRTDTPQATSFSLKGNWFKTRGSY